MDSVHDQDLYPHIEPYQSGRLDLDHGHEMAFELSGNPSGLAVVFLHGGPGAGTVSSQRRFFDPNVYRIILYDQRGAGRSYPKAETRHNTTQDLIADLEKLREHLGVARWLVFGGSWGATLALAYGETHPDRCLGFVLRGVFLGSRAEIEWFLGGIASVFPEAHAALVDHVGDGDLLPSYRELLFDPDPDVHLPAARAWARFESACSTLLPPRMAPSGGAFDGFALALARLEAHYFQHDMFLEPDQLLANIDRIGHLPALIVQGRYDMVCPPFSAYALAEAWPAAELDIIADAGHSPFEPGIRRALVRATDQLGGQLSAIA